MVVALRGTSYVPLRSRDVVIVDISRVGLEGIEVVVWFWGEAAAAAAAAVAVSAPPGAVIVPASASATIAVRAAAAAAKTAGAATSAPAAKAAATSASAATVAAAVASSATAAGAAVAAVATGAASASATGAVVGTIPSAVGAAAAATGAAVGRTTTGATSAAATTASPVGTTLALPLQLTSVGNLVRPGFDSIFIGKSFVGVTLVMGLSATDTALSMRRKVATRIATMQLPRRRGGGGGLSEDRFRLVWSGKAVDSGSSLMSLGIQPNHTLEAVFYHAAGVGKKDVRKRGEETLVTRMLRENVGCRCNGDANCWSIVYPRGNAAEGKLVFEPESRPAKVLVGAFCEVVFREVTPRMYNYTDRVQKMAKDFWRTLQISPGHPKRTPSTATDFFRCYVNAVEKETGVTFTEPPFFKDVFVAHMGMTPDKRSMFFDHYEAGDNQTNVNNLQIRRHIHDKLCNMRWREVPWRWETAAIRHSLQRALNFPRVPLLPKFVCERAAGVPKEQSIFIDGAFCSYFCQNCSQPGATVAPQIGRAHV